MAQRQQTLVLANLTPTLNRPELQLVLLRVHISNKHRWQISRCLLIYLSSSCLQGLKEDKTRHHKHAGPANREDVVSLPTVSI
jgi:hypothetical protein